VSELADVIIEVLRDFYRMFYEVIVWCWNSLMNALIRLLYVSFIERWMIFTGR